MYQKPVIDHCPWPSSQFNKWHVQNELLSSSLIVIGSSSLPPHTSEPLSPQGLYIIIIMVFLRRNKICFRFDDISKYKNLMIAHVFLLKGVENIQ
jgi:hypothetical protein